MANEQTARPVFAEARVGGLSARERMSQGAHRALVGKRAAAAEGRAAAIAFREGRRCHCGALGYVPCAHRPNGVEGVTSAASERMPFANHRTVAEVRAA